MGLLSEAHRQDQEGDPQQSPAGTPHPAHQTDGADALRRPPHPGVIGFNQYVITIREDETMCSFPLNNIYGTIDLIT